VSGVVERGLEGAGPQLSHTFFTFSPCRAAHTNDNKKERTTLEKKTALTKKSRILHIIVGSVSWKERDKSR